MTAHLQTGVQREGEGNLETLRRQGDIWDVD